jgi:hypothetical protein
MSTFEKILLAIATTAEAELPIFVHSNQGLMILNAGETLLGNILQAFAPAPAAPTPTAPAPTA